MTMRTLATSSALSLATGL